MSAYPLLAPSRPGKIEWLAVLSAEANAEYGIMLMLRVSVSTWPMRL